MCLLTHSRIYDVFDITHLNSKTHLSCVFLRKLFTMSWSVHEKNPNDDWLYEMKSDVTRQCQFLLANNVAKPPACDACESECEVVLLTKPRDLTRYKLPYAWSCTNADCKKLCGFLTGSYLKGHSVSLFKHVQLLYKFYRKRNAKQCHEETGVGYGTCIKWFDYYRRCVSKYMQDHFYPEFQFDVDLAIEWDEAKLSARQKDHRGRYREGVWVLGGVQREKNLILLKVVDRRNADTLQPIISAVCPEGSTVITDGWRGYLGLSDRGHYHWNVDHSRTFRNPFTGMHTDTIEGLWALIRGELRLSRGIKSPDLQKHLDVFAFRRNTTNSDSGTWVSFCCLIGAMQHVVPTPT